MTMTKRLRRMRGLVGVCGRVFDSGCLADGHECTEQPLPNSIDPNALIFV